MQEPLDRLGAEGAGEFLAQPAGRGGQGQPLIDGQLAAPQP
nr:hypothetical protein [Streptosporangium canum]